MSTSGRPSPSPHPAIGWREWVQLPDLAPSWIKAKVDTGARTSALHVFDLREFSHDGEPWIRFEIHPVQRSVAGAVECCARIADRRSVRSSSGRSEMRPVIETDVVLGDERWVVEITLTRRDEMGFRMLLGRQAIRRRFVVDPGRSYRAGKPPTENS